MLRRCVLIAVLLPLACGCRGGAPSSDKARAEMVRLQIAGRGISDPAILKAFGEVPREEFVLPKFRAIAYDDIEAPFGFGQTLDRPYEDALMAKALGLGGSDRVLEVGTGSGYLSAVLARIASEVFTIEIEPEIADFARERLAAVGAANVHVRTGDGFLGWPEHAPFDAMILTCSPTEVPKPLIEQLAEGGRIVLPVGGSSRFQELILYSKVRGQLIERKRLSPTEFVPMKGEATKR